MSEQKTKIPNNNASVSVQSLIKGILFFKAQETEAAEARVAHEQALALALGFDKSEGSETATLEGYKVTLTAKLNRKLDEKKWLEVAPYIPEQLRPVKEKTTFMVDDKGCRWLELNEPEIYAKVAKALTVKPAKVAIKIIEAK